MNPKQTPPPPAAVMSLEDIYYILFRRKWVILFLSLLGFIAARAAYAYWKPVYKSVAEMYIGYVLADANIPSATGVQVHPMMDQGTGILATELKLVESLDLAKQVAETIGPARILGNNDAGTNSADVDKAAMLIKDNLLAEVSPMTHIISLTFSHHDPELIQPVLDLVITNYIKRHYLVHQRTDVFDPLVNSWADVRKMRVQSTADQLAQIKAKAGIIDIAEEMKAFTVHEAQIKQENYLAMTELAEALARAEQLRNLIPTDRGQAASAHLDQGAATNASAPAAPPPTPDQQEAYSAARQRVADLKAKEDKLELTWTTNYSIAKTNLLDIEAAEAKLKALEKATPSLVAAAASPATVEESKTTAAPVARTGSDPAAAYNDELAKIAGLSVRIARQTNELALIKDRGTNLVQLQVTIHELERDMAVDEDELRQFEKDKEEAAMREELGPDRVSNIFVSEQPTPPVPETRQRLKLVAGFAGGGVALGLVLAFLLEMVLDRSFKRPQEVASKLGLTFFLSVPYLNGDATLRLPKQGKQAGLLPASAGSPNGGDAEAARRSLDLPGGGANASAAADKEGRAPAPVVEGLVAPWAERPAWRPYYETLRDRLIAYFERANLTHKPKLVALAGCHRGAGVSTLASGLACSLSETGDGTVLLVNMNSEEGDTHRFYHGALNLGLDEIFEKEKPNLAPALVQDNLYVVSESSNGDKLSSILPKRFNHLVSKMKASDYDYIIFDMPPVTQISVTPRLARFMDMVLLVVEAEKTDRDVAQRAVSLLLESRANLGVVMNRNRSYVPRWLLQEM